MRSPGATGRLRQNNLTQALFNLPAGNWSAGDRSIAAHPDRIHAFQQGMARARVRVSTGRASTQLSGGKRDEQIPLEEQTRVRIEDLRYAARALAEREMTLLVEHLNPYDVPRFLIVTPHLVRRD